jgi:hypothetical protein
VIITALLVVKIKTKTLFIGLFVFMLVISTAYAAGSKLVFSDVDVKVGSDTSRNLKDGDSIDDEAKPGDTVEFRIELRNNFTNAEDLEMEDISVEVTIEEIDDGDDLSEESKEFDLDPDDEDRITLRFEIPEDVDEDSYDVIIEAEGEDQNGTRHSATMRLDLEVDKETHLIKITRATLLPSSVQCNRKNVQLGVSLANVGAEDEDGVRLRLSNSDLGLDVTETIPELSEDFEDDENKFSKTYTFSVPATAEAGNYPVLVSAIYNKDRKRAEQTATLTVNECQLEQPATPSNNGSGNDDVEILVPPSDDSDTETIIIPEGTVVTSEFSLGSPLAIFMMAAIGLIVIAAIVALVLLIRR